MDFVLDELDGPVAVEVGLSARHDLSGLKAIAAKIPRVAGRCFYVSPEAPLLRAESASDGIGRVPLDLFLVAASAQIAARTHRRFIG